MTKRSEISILMRRPALWLAAGALLGGVAVGCQPVRSEGLAMLDVSVAADVPAFMKVRFAVAGRSDIPQHDLAYNGQGPLKLGYYLPGPGGTVRVAGQALSPADCPVGVGTAEVEVRPGQVSPSVPLLIARVADIDPACLAPPDAAADGPDTTDAATEARADTGATADTHAETASSDGRADATGDGASAGDAAADKGVVTPADAHAEAPPPPPDAGPPPPPACMIATKSCPGASNCCSGLRCGTTTLGQVCCGDFGQSCMRQGGEDCCGQLECVKNICCLPATYQCGGLEGSCCPGLVCGNTTLGHVCCGNKGAPCMRRDGADCCGSLECVNNVCQ